MPRLLFLLSGSISCYKACHAISRLVQAKIEVQTVTTPGALRFIGTATLEGLTGRAPFTDLWVPGRAMDHIDLARWADLALLCPATANTLNRLASGLARRSAGAPRSSPARA